MIELFWQRFADQTVICQALFLFLIVKKRSLSSKPHFRHYPTLSECYLSCSKLLDYLIFPSQIKKIRLKNIKTSLKIVI
jgi:hypothetical protein